ncbi:MAG TPA: hypothetical protein VMI73_07260 [Trebonia sp.]|nr:hypothetical protein [Trebonia sp.]
MRLRAELRGLRVRAARRPAGRAAQLRPSAGQRWRYFLAPWGMQFELVSYPGGKAYERDGAAVMLWHPGRPER